mgnify:CR=1 FL=1
MFNPERSTISCSYLEAALRRVSPTDPELLRAGIDLLSNCMEARECLGKLARAVDPNDKNAPSIIQAAQLVKRAIPYVIEKRNESLANSEESAIYLTMLRDWLEGIATVLNYPALTPEFQDFLKNSLKSDNKQTRTDGCKMLFELAQSEEFLERRVARDIVIWVHEEELKCGKSSFNNEVIKATIFAAAKLPPENFIHWMRIYDLELRLGSGIYQHLVQEVFLNNITADVLDSDSFSGTPSLLSFTDLNGKGFRNLLSALVSKLRVYDARSLNNAIEIFSKRPKLAFSLLTSELEVLISRGDQKCYKLLEALLKLPRQKLRLAIYIDKLLVAREGNLPTNLVEYLKVVKERIPGISKMLHRFLKSF